MRVRVGWLAPTRACESTMLAFRKVYHVGAVSRQRRTGIYEAVRAEQGDVIALGYDRPDGGAFYRRRRDEIERLTGSGLDSIGIGRSRAAREWVGGGI